MRKNFLATIVFIASAIIVGVSMPHFAVALTFYTAPTPSGFTASASACGNDWLNLSWNTVASVLPGNEIKYTVTEGARVVYDGTSTAVSDVGLVLGSTHNYTIIASYFIPAVYDIDGTMINPQNVDPFTLPSAPAFASGVVPICVTVAPDTYSITLPTTAFTASYVTFGGGPGITCRLLDFAGTPLTAYGACSGSISGNTPAGAGDYLYSVQMKRGDAMGTLINSNTFTVTVVAASPPPAPATPTGFTASASACGNDWLNLSWNAPLHPLPPNTEIEYIVKEGARLVYQGTSTAVSDIGLVLGSTHNYMISDQYIGPGPYAMTASLPAFTSGTVASVCITVTVAPNTYSITLPTSAFTASYVTSGAGVGATCRLLDFAGVPLTAYSACGASMSGNTPAVAGDYTYAVQMKPTPAPLPEVTSNTFTVTVNPAIPPPPPPPPVVTMTPDFTVSSGAPWSVTMTYNQPAGNYVGGCQFTRTSVEYGDIPTTFIATPVYTAVADPDAFIGPGTIVYTARCLIASQTWSPVVSTTVTVLAPVPSFSITPVPGSFSFVPLGGSRTIAFQVENPTGEFASLLSGSISTTDAHFTCAPAPCNYAVPVGGSQSFDITYTPDAVGADSGNIVFTDNAIGSPHSWVIWGVGTVPVIALPPQVDFGPVPIVRSKDLTFTIKNISPLNLGFSTFGGYDGVVFQCISPAPPAPDTCAPNGINLAPDVDNIITMRFVPTLPQPYHAVGTLSILPAYSVSLDGVGVSPAFYLYED